MTRLILTVIALSIAVGIAAAFAQLGQPAPMVPYSQPGGSMLGLGGPMIPNAGAGSGPTPPVGNDLLLEDNASFLLLEDGTSNLCLESGC